MSWKDQAIRIHTRTFGGNSRRHLGAEIEEPLNDCTKEENGSKIQPSFSIGETNQNFSPDESLDYEEEGIPRSRKAATFVKARIL